MPHETATLHLDTPDQTCELAQAFGAHLIAGDTILLSGGVGAGKTHFARCLIQSVLVTPEDVPSPTFTLVQTYPNPRGDIWHADLYRLTDIGEVDELGLSEAFDTAICLIEWPDRLGDDAPTDALTLHFDAPHSDDRRLAVLTWSNPRWTATLQEVLND